MCLSLSIWMHSHKNNMPTLSGRIRATLPHSAWRPPPPLLCARASVTSTSRHGAPCPSRPACCATSERGNVGYVSISGVVPPSCASYPPPRLSPTVSHCQRVLRTLSSSRCHSHCTRPSLSVLPPTSKYLPRSLCLLHV